MLYALAKVGKSSESRKSPFFKGGFRGILKTHSAGMEILPFRTVITMVSKGMLT